MAGAELQAMFGTLLDRWRGIALTGSVMLGLVYTGWLMSGNGCEQIIHQIHCRMPMEPKLVALTFDDGPTAEGVDGILPILKEHDARATFFLTGSEIDRYPQGAKRLVATGHELGNHGYTHSMMIFRTPWFYRDQIARTDALLREADEDDPIAFRPPYGRKLIGLPLEVERAGYHMITWTVHEPAPGGTPEDYAAHILKQVRHGGIALMHPMHDRRETVIAALPIILDGLDELGFTTVTISELLQAGGVIAQGDQPDRPAVAAAKREAIERTESGEPLTLEERFRRGF